MEHRIKNLRSAIGLTQEQLSERVGVLRQTIISIESVSSQRIQRSF
ncbi:helix-turn-helix transcriptional regulator [Paenibacillus dokdonensis]|nr:helix-turn-helix domain-containing protein [Paenibacillus dokdonensis]